MNATASAQSPKFLRNFTRKQFCQLLRVTRKRSCTSAGNAQAQLHFRDDQQRAFGISNIPNSTKNNACALLSRILSILNLDWLQHARSVRGVYECIWNRLRAADCHAAYLAGTNQHRLYSVTNNGYQIGKFTFVILLPRFNAFWCFVRSLNANDRKSGQMMRGKPGWEYDDE